MHKSKSSFVFSRELITNSKLTSGSDKQKISFTVIYRRFVGVNYLQAMGSSQSHPFLLHESTSEEECAGITCYKCGVTVVGLTDKGSTRIVGKGRIRALDKIGLDAIGIYYHFSSAEISTAACYISVTGLSLGNSTKITAGSALIKFFRKKSKYICTSCFAQHHADFLIKFRNKDKSFFVNSDMTLNYERMVTSELK